MNNKVTRKSMEFLVPYPSKRDVVNKSSVSWIEGKRIDDGVGEHWRVHDNIYDLTDFIDKHPGGRFWLESTRGTDVTEAFESSHLNPAVDKILSKYFVREATTPRNAPYTFHENGFYKTLKRRVWAILSEKGTGPNRKMILMIDAMATLFLILFILTILSKSYLMALITGIELGMTMTMAHNFFHQADNFRMYYFDLSPLSSEEWRTTHAISHHLFPNTLYDFEISALEPFILFLPDPQKHVIYKLLMPLLTIGMFLFTAEVEVVKRLVDFIQRNRKPKIENCLTFLELFFLVAFVGDAWLGIMLWSIIASASVFAFGYSSLIGAHHHPEIYHTYDKFRESPDWGLCQLDATRDRIETTGSLFLTSITFGDHSLHHLFPTVDHSKLPLLYPTFLETCEQFDIPYTFWRQTELLKGTFQQILSSTPNKKYPGHKKTHERILPDHLKSKFK